MLILVCGLPGSGKTKIVQEISKLTNILVLSTDEIRKKLFKKPKYTKDEKWLVYKVMFLMAEEFLKNKMSIILDATFPWRLSRIQVKRIAKQYKSSFKMIEARCQEPILLKRIGRRIKKGDLSDADIKIYFKIKKEFEPIRGKHIVIDNSKALKDLKKKIKEISRILKPN